MCSVEVSSLPSSAGRVILLCILVPLLARVGVGFSPSYIPAVALLATRDGSIQWNPDAAYDWMYLIWDTYEYPIVHNTLRPTGCRFVTSRHPYLRPRLSMPPYGCLR